jgi:hypothetical protein
MPRAKKAQTSTNTARTDAVQSPSSAPWLTTYKPGQQIHIANLSRLRAEDCADWPFLIPREVMDKILGDPTLGVREHLALAGA